MTAREKLNGEYFEWLCEIVREKDGLDSISFRKLLLYLHTVDFKWIIPKDQNRAEDGIVMRYRFATERSNDSNTIGFITNTIDGPCSVLEMMVAIAVHCEEDIMDDPTIGDRTGQWFWKMIINLGLGAMTDDRFDIKKVEQIVDRFLNREYEPDGRGGLFRVRGSDRDLREVEIYWQMCWYLNTIT